MTGTPAAIRLPRLYPILDVDVLTERRLAPTDVVEAWLGSGITLIQLRAKHLEGGPFLTLARTLRARTARAGIRLLINDRVDIAALAEAEGVHVGQDDLSPDDVRGVLGAHAIVGLSTHSDAQMHDAVRTSASYLAIGPVFATQSKANPDAAVGLAGVARAAAIAAAAGRPLVAIGGISLAHASAVLRAGASSVAVISDLIAPDLAERARAFVAALRSEPV